MKKLTLRDQVGKLRKQGISNAVIAERFGISCDSVRVHWYLFNNLNKKKVYANQYYKKNKDRIVAYVTKWQIDNPDRLAEYRYRTKCRQAGVQYES